MHDFEFLISEPSYQSYLSSLDIEHSEARGLFTLLDTDGSGDVTVEEFVAGCLRLKGAATAVDMVTLLYENKKQTIRDTQQYEILLKRCDQLQESMSSCFQTLRNEYLRTRPAMLSPRTGASAPMRPMLSPRKSARPHLTPRFTQMTPRFTQNEVKPPDAMTPRFTQNEVNSHQTAPASGRKRATPRNKICRPSLD